MKKALLIGLMLVGASLQANAAGVEVYSKQLNGCVVWDKNPTSSFFYLNGFNKPLKGACDHYNYAKWFEGGAASYVAQNLRMYQTSYGFDKALGRAWIEIAKDQTYMKNSGRYSDKDLFTIDTGRYHVEGLSFDAANNAIVLNGNVIATVKTGVGFLGLGVEITGAKPALSIVEKTIDDGFSWQYESPFVAVTLE